MSFSTSLMYKMMELVSVIKTKSCKNYNDLVSVKTLLEDSHVTNLLYSSHVDAAKKVVVRCNLNKNF